MPLRYTSTGAALHRFPLRISSRSQRFFHASPCPRANPSNHYDTLNVHPDATPAEIKKSFYTLSKRHHPDHNPSDPHAPSRFMRISEAYAILGHADKRARYDRDVMRRGNLAYHSAPNARPSGSYHSSTSGPAGGRPASGLSRRRSSFQGPPPSFFRSGGWGAHGAKRRAAHEESTGGWGAGYGTNSHSQSHSNPNSNPSSAGGGGGGDENPFGTGGMGPGQNSHRPIYDEEIPHFDRAAHERAQRRGDERRARRMAEQKGVNLEGPDRGTTMSFWAVATILAAVVSGPFVISWAGNPRAERTGDRERSQRDRGENERRGK